MVAVRTTLLLAHTRTGLPASILPPVEEPLMTDLEARRALGLPVGILLAPETIKRAWKEAALRTHPDRGGSPDVFVVVSLAAQTLREMNGVPSIDNHRSGPSHHSPAPQTLRMISGPAPSIRLPSVYDPDYEERQRMLESMYGSLGHWGRSGDGFLHLWNRLYGKRRKE